MKTKKGDFIEMDFIGKVKATNQIFDLTKESDAKKNNLYNPKQTYKPVKICLGENEIIKGLDEQLINKEINKTYKIEIPQEKAFGKKNPKLIKLIPAKVFKQQRITPFPGLQVNLDQNLMGTVRAVSGGRIIVDFNHPLAGKNIEYEVIINKIITDKKEKIEAILKTDKFTIKNNELKVELQIPEQFQEILKKQIKNHIKNIKKITFLKQQKKNTKD